MSHCPEQREDCPLCRVLAYAEELLLPVTREHFLAVLRRRREAEVDRLLEEFVLELLAPKFGLE